VSGADEALRTEHLLRPARLLARQMWNYRLHSTCDLGGRLHFCKVLQQTAKSH